MNRVYYYLDGSDQKGPLAIEQLKSAGITPDTLVWAEGFENWTPAKEVDELSILIMATTPPPPQIANMVPPPVQTFDSAKVNMENTKKCPHCGEEILAVAIKCKHCGEMLDNAPTTRQKKITVCPACAEEIEDGLKTCPVCKEPLENIGKDIYAAGDKPNYALLKWICYAAMAFGVISAIQDEGTGRFGLWLTIANSIPEWIVIIGECATFVFLMLGLRKHYLMNSADRPVPFIALISLYIAVSFFSLMALNENIAEEMDIIALLAIISAVVLEFIVGLQLKRRLEEASSVGMAMMICYPLIVVVTMIGYGFSENEELPLLANIVILGAIIAFYWILKDFFEKQADLLPHVTTSHRGKDATQRLFTKDKKKTVTAIVVGAIALVAVIAFLSGRSQTSKNLITPTSIAGVEVIGKTPEEVKAKFGEGFRWDYINDWEFEGIHIWTVYKGETVVFVFFANDYGTIGHARIFDPSYSTADRLSIGSTSGDILKKHPQATLNRDDEGSDFGIGEWTEFNGIIYSFDWEKTAGNYSNSNVSKIVNRDSRVVQIIIYGQ